MLRRPRKTPRSTEPRRPRGTPVALRFNVNAPRPQGMPAALSGMPEASSVGLAVLAVVAVWGAYKLLAPKRR